MPLIGITACRKLEDYRQSVLHTDGEVRVLDLSMELSEALEGVKGLMLTGGEDVAPARYREEPHATVVDRKSTRLNSSHIQKSRMPSSA